jgi:Flp pilus assembly secretin CpaC
MVIEHKNNNIIITGNIKTLEESQQINESISDLVAHGSRHIHLTINDSFSMTSTVIGFLMKVVHHDKVQLSISVVDSRLHTLLDELSLIEIFKVSIVSP